jgi:hypothetical protein
MEYAKGDSLTLIDLCVINDYTSFKQTSLTLKKSGREKRGKEIMSLYHEAFKKEDGETIAWEVKNTNIATRLNLSFKKLEQ